MNHNTKNKFYVFELKMHLSGRYVQNDPKLSSAEKIKNKKEFFYDILHTNDSIKAKYNLLNIMRFLRNHSDPSYSTDNSKTLFKGFKSLSDNDELMACLFFYANKSLQSSDLYDFSTTEERAIEQKPTEAPRLISHMIMRITKNHITDEIECYVALEERAYINPSQVTRSLNSLLKQWTTLYTHEGRSIHLYPTLEVHAFKSETLKDMLKTGKLKNIQFIKNTQVNDSQDSSPFTITSRSELIMKPPADLSMTGDMQLSGLRDVIKVHSADYDRLKVTIDANGASKTNEYNLSMSEEQILQDYFYHKECLEFDPNIVSPNYTKIVDPIVDRVITEVLSDEKLKLSN